MKTKQRNKKQKIPRWVVLLKEANDMTVKELHEAIADVCWTGDQLDWEFRNRSRNNLEAEIVCNNCGSLLN